MGRLPSERRHGHDTIEGGTGDDIIEGDETVTVPGDDLLIGGSGNDEIYGYSGDDTIIGGDGDDLIESDNGDDLLTGGTGADTFYFTHGNGMDIVTDFQSGEDVVILALASDERESDVHYQTILTGEGVLIEYFHQDQMSGLVLLQAITTIQPEDVLVVA